MYRRFIYTITAVLSAAVICSCSSVSKTSAFIPRDGMPDASVFLLSPPAPGTAQFYADSCQYEWGKTVRGTQRGEMAVADAAISADYFAKIFSEPLGLEISREKTPEIFKLIQRTIPTVRQSIATAKRKFNRKRPFVLFGEPPCIPSDAKGLGGTPSYPSGHTIRGWAIALVLSEVNPAAQNELLIRGFEYGQSRVILGVHYQSDVDAARLAAGACVARMNIDQDFRRQLTRAQKEFRKLSR